MIGLILSVTRIKSVEVKPARLKPACGFRFEYKRTQTHKLPVAAIFLYVITTLVKNKNLIPGHFSCWGPIQLVPLFLILLTDCFEIMNINYKLRTHR